MCTVIWELDPPTLFLKLIFKTINITAYLVTDQVGFNLGLTNDQPPLFKTEENSFRAIAEPWVL
jgi:hypothetical protein